MLAMGEVLAWTSFVAFVHIGIILRDYSSLVVLLLPLLKD